MTVLPRPWTFQGWWPLDFTLDFAGLLDFHGPLCSWFGHVLRRPWRFLAVICESALSGCLDFVPCGPCLSRLLACSLSWFRVVLTVTWLLLVLFLPRLPRLATRPHQVVGSSLSVMPPRLRLWLCFLCLWRVGEAYKPGPEFTVGVANLNGLHNKAFGFADSDVHTWILSETHLTKGGIISFQSNLHQAKAPYKAFIHGCPVAARSETSDIGQWSGVGVLSMFPSRRLPHSWPSVAYGSGRLVCSGFCAHGVWVSGVTVYGTPTGHTHVQGRSVANDLLSLALDRVLQLSGPRFIAGDFNHDLDHLSTVAMMERLGFMDIQDIHAERTGVLPVATCRGKTRRDYMFVSRELAGLFLRCHVDDESVSDHSYLIGTFAGDQALLTRFVWPIPDPVEWEPAHKRSNVDLELFRSPDALTADYEQFWSQVESNNSVVRHALRKPVLRASLGRGRQKHPITRDGQLAPTKTSRPGDKQPAFLGSCVQHAQWLKQLRRLQSYVRLARVPVPSDAHRAHRFGLWTSIRLAPGFCPSFSEWWCCRALAVGDPLVVPLEPPGLDDALLFYAGFDVDFTRLEASLNSARSHANRLAKASDIHAIYRSVQRDIPVQVDSLVGTTSAVVTEVDEDECAVITDKPEAWNPDVPVMHSTGPLQIIHADHDKLWVDSCAGVFPGDTLHQTSFTVRLPALFEAFETYWKGLWNQHASVPDSQWDDIVQFAAAQLRPMPASAPSFTVNAVRRCVQRKSARSATSLDGVSRRDVLALSDSDLGLLLRVFHVSGLTGAWPQQVLNGYVRSLAKISDPLVVGHYRPITVFSVWYRAWSSVAARHWLAQLADVTDPFLCGNATGCRAGMVWRYVLEQVEAAHRDEVEACGFSADIVKAFNALPRRPALLSAKLLGLDQATLVSWAGALSGFQRHFVISGSYSPGVSSVNGFPEGCAMSCVSMMILTQLFHLWMRACNTMFQPVSYVDNWAVILRNVDHMTQAVNAVDRFADMLHIQLDAKKSFTWSTHADGRRRLRQAGFRVLLSTRELGAHVVYSRQLANKTALDRFRCLVDFWAKLGASGCAFRQKIMLITRVAWPRAMHAISSVVVGKHHFSDLRTAMMQALNLQKPGANPILQAGLESLSMDPQVYAILDTIRDARALGVNFCVVHDLDAGPLGDSPPQFNTVSEILCQRLHQVGFVPQLHGVVCDSIGTFRLLDCPFGELLLRVQIAWTSVMAARVSHRPSFQGFESVDVQHTRLAYLAFDQLDQGILRKHLHGANLTNEHAQHWSSEPTDQCAHCCGLDSVRHRLWDCPATQHLRDLLPLGFLHDVSTLPRVVSEHGWTLRAGLAPAWLSYLATLPSTVQFAPAGQLAPILDVFTDGSCLFPADRDLRVASWAVVLAMPFQLEFQAADFRPLAAQPLDGLLQSAFRAELKALTVALDFAVTTRRGIRVWTDCQSVIDVWITFVRDGRSVNANAKHSDLLQDLQRLAQDLDLACVEVLKVPAHVDAAAFTNDLERWLVTGNDFADRAAKQANLMRSEGDWALWHAYAQQLQLQQFQANQVRAHIVAVGKFWTASAPPPVSPEVRWSRPVKAGRAQPVPRWEAPDVLVLVGPTFLRSFGSELADRLGRWLTRIRAPSEPLQWISYHQLFVSFHKDEGPFFVTKTDGKWVAETGNVSHLANHVRLGQRVKHFRLMLQQFLRDCQVTFTTATVRPRSEWIACFKGAIAFQLAQSEWDMLEGYFASQLARPVAGDGKGLDQLTL